MENERLIDLKTGLESAYINGSVAANVSYLPSFVSNNPNEGKKVISVVEDELLRCDKFQISVAFITMGGVVSLLPTFKMLEDRNVPGEILTTNYLDFTAPEALERLNKFKNITIKMFDVNNANQGFHSKGYIFKKGEIYRIIVGSSNLTSDALTSNIEWNTKIISTEQGEVAADIEKEFCELWNSEYSLDYESFFPIYKARYEIIKHQREIAKKEILPSFEKYTLKPNSMQEEFIANLSTFVERGDKRALLISATGTGKTYAAAFAMRELGFKRVLFVVHRMQLAKQAKESFSRVFDSNVSMGIVGGGLYEYDKDYVFAMVETLHKEGHISKYEPDSFDCIILDEAHHSPANSYGEIINYFNPQLFIGMTATPDKRDDYLENRNVYEIFDRNIALEIRLQKAMEDKLLCPFRYFGISDITMGDTRLGDKISDKDFSKLTSSARVDHVIEQAKFYGYSGERVKGLIFCSRIAECEALSSLFNKRGFRTVALSGDNSPQEREEAFERLAMSESEATADKQPLDYILSVDILNEGVDIVEVNQVIMLRPTQSPIVFIQQLGRGLRKAEGKEYVVILDFIGNYDNNFMIPVALSGDRTYNADIIRKYVISGNSIIPGASTIHFDEIAKEKIFASIDKITPGTFKKIIKEGYTNLKNRLGRIPMLIDFYKCDEVDPLIIIREYKTYYAFIEAMEKKTNIFTLKPQERLTLEYLSKTVLSGVRVVELEILRLLLENESISYDKVISNCKNLYGYSTSINQIQAASNVLKGEFVANAGELSKFRPIEILELDRLSQISRILSFATRLGNSDFYNQVKDIIDVGLARYEDKYKKPYSIDNPFVLYEKYSRRDICLLMNAGRDMSSTMYGMSRIGDDVFIFVTYHKEENTDESMQYIEGRPDYADEFCDNLIFRWDSQIGSGIGGKYMKKVLEAPNKHLFVQKTDRENNFFYMGTFSIVDVYETTKVNNRGVSQPICKLKFIMNTAVRDDLLHYLQSETSTEEKSV